MELSRAQRRALDAIADTFYPGAVEQGVPQAFLELLVPRLRTAEREQLRRLLTLFAFSGFPRRTRSSRERVLLRWAGSRVGLRGTGFHALRKGVLLLAYSFRDERGGNPTWPRLGYPGPRGGPGEPAGEPLETSVPAAETSLDCDVCVVGSGAGGGVAAAVLATAGLDVVVLEAGAAYDERHFDGAELDALQRLYLGGGTTASDDQAVAILAGGPTKQLLNNLDIWIAPSINPDGGHYSFYDFSSQRRNMTRHCPVTGSFDLLARNSWGVDNNRNYTEYSLFDGYDGASTSCTSDVYAGPAELSEPENQNLDWLAARPNVKFAMNLHSSGNYFMWSPGAYALPGRISAPRPTLEEESYFWGASSRILTAIKRHRGLSVTPARTGPISDVLYSAAGNSGDMLWYKYDIYAWNFEVGTQFQPPWEGTTISSASAHQEALEFSNGLVELVRVAYDFGKDKTRPESTIAVTASSTAGDVNVKFQTSEPAAVFYTLDGSTPTYASTLYASAGIREGGELLTVPTGTMIHWFSVDSAGNVEKNYRPDGGGRNYNKAPAVLGG